MIVLSHFYFNIHLTYKEKQKRSSLNSYFRITNYLIYFKSSSAVVSESDSTKLGEASLVAS